MQQAPVGAKDLDYRIALVSDSDDVAVWIGGDARRDVIVESVAYGSRVRAVRIKDLEAGVAGIGDDDLVVRAHGRAGRVHKLARSAPVAAKAKGRRAVRVEHVHKARPGLGYNNPVERVEGHAGVDGARERLEGEVGLAVVERA